MDLSCTAVENLSLLVQLPKNLRCHLNMCVCERGQVFIKVCHFAVYLTVMIFVSLFLTFTVY